MTIRIDEEFRSYIPSLTAEERAQLETNIVSEGCLDPLIVWDGVLIDGHNRFEICTRLGVHYDVVQRFFTNREAALDWMDAHQLGRRNLSPDARKLLLGRRYNRMKKAPNDGGVGVPKATVDQNDLRFTTAAKLAQEHGVSEATVKRAGKFAEDVDADEGLRAAVAAGVPVAQVRSKPIPAPPVAANDAGSPEEAKLRRKLAQMTEEGLIETAVELSRALADEKARSAIVLRERNELKKQIDEILSASGDSGEVIRKLQAKVKKAENDRWRAEEKASGFIRENYALKRKIEGRAA